MLRLHRPDGWHQPIPWTQCDMLSNLHRDLRDRTKRDGVVVLNPAMRTDQQLLARIHLAIAWFGPDMVGDLGDHDGASRQRV